MSQIITPNNPQFSSLYTSLFANHNWASGIGMLGRGFAKPLAIIDALNPGGSTPFSDSQGIFRTAYQPYEVVVQQVGAVAQAGANLIITWLDPNYAAFRLKMVIRDDNNIQGLVVATGPGTVTIQPWMTGALVAANHFTAGMFATEMGSGSGNHNSSGVTGLYETLGTRLNYSAVMRDSQPFSSREKFSTIKNNGSGGDENVYGFYLDETFLIERFMRARMLKCFFSEPGQEITAEGTANSYEGFRAAVRNQGGRFVGMATLFTQTDFEGDLAWMATNDPAQRQDFVCFLGRQAWSRIASFYSGDIGFTVSKATVDGQELDFTVSKLTINGVTVQFVIVGIFDDKKLFPSLSAVAGAGLKMSNTYCIANLAPIPNKNGGVIPCVRKFHFANSPVTGGAEILYRYVPGMIGIGDSNSTGLPTMMGYQAAGSSVMGASFEIAQDGGFDFAADACVWRELNA
jgi:hypothetical protein